MSYLVCFLCGAVWTMFLTLEKYYISRRHPTAAAINTFAIALFWILLFKHFAHQNDTLEILAYSLGCSLSTYTVLRLLPSEPPPTKKPPGG